MHATINVVRDNGGGNMFFAEIYWVLWGAIIDPACLMGNVDGGY